MKHHKIVMLLFSLLFIYACEEETTHQEVVETIENDKDEIIITDTVEITSQADLKPKVINCSYSLEEIGQHCDPQSQVALVGLFENIKSTEDHSYGYAVKLWQVDLEIIGFFNLYEGDVEPTRTGPIVFGQLLNDSLSFTAWTQQSKGYKNWQQSDVHIYTFSGKKSEQNITGDFSIVNCANEDADPVIEVQVELPSSDIWELNNFNTIEEWRTYYNYDLER